MNEEANLAFKDITLDGAWTQLEERFVFVLRAEGIKETNYGQLRNLLFAWHEPSWYGTMIEETKLNGRTILILNSEQAFQFLTYSQPNTFIKLKCSEQLDILKKLAKLYEQVMLNGWFVPDTINWSREQSAWRVQLPEHLHTEYNTYSERIGKDAAERWFSLLIEQLIETNPTVKQAWRELLQHNGESQMLTTISDAEQWLVTVGFEQDQSPFKLALSLHEPKRGSQDWYIRTSILDTELNQWFLLEYKSELGYCLINSEKQYNSVPVAWLEQLKLKLEKETFHYEQVLGYPLTLDEHLIIEQLITEHEAWQFLELDSERLLQAGCKVILPAWWEQIRNRKLKIKGKVKSNIGSASEPMFGLNQIVQFDWKFALGDQELTEDQFMELTESNRKLIQINDEWIYLSTEDIAQVKKWLKTVYKKKGLTFSDVLQMHLRGEHAEFFEESEEEQYKAEIELNHHLDAWLDTLRHIQQIPLVDKPDGFTGELRPYQLQGASWLLFLRRFGLGAILADDMGLGKTIQLIAYLTHIKEHEKKSNKPALLICPTSVIGNWERELRKFAPTLKVKMHYGQKRFKQEEFVEYCQDADLVITSYALAHIDQDDLHLINWDVLCLDEAQNIKNAYTKQSLAIRKLPSFHRIALTGTPMENRLTELWSLYDFINPGYLGSLYQFRKSMIAPIERTKDEQIIAGLQRWVKPFMLRRVKKDPAISLSLPEKMESKSFIPLTTEQVSLYENVVSELISNIERVDLKQKKGLILSSLTKLKQLCDHPALFLQQEGKKQWEITRSSKLERLVEIVDQIAEQQERCLIFTQYIEMGHQIQKLLSQRYELPVPYLHGGVAKHKRDEMIDTFQDESIPQVAFVLSLKAGGTGLNLTAANHVIHFDRWWNPAVENQATDRAFRIGQVRQVEVHKFITIGTIEEKIDEMIESKMSLNEQIVQQSDQWITELNNSEIKELFTLRHDWLKE